MEQITSSKKYQNGVRVFWTETGNRTEEFFFYEELIDQKINVLDLLNNPHLYLVNAPGHRIEPVTPGCSFPSKTCEGEIILTRFFDAPREMVWDAWTNPKIIREWWGPKDFTAPSISLDLREGGSYLYCMRSPEGKNFWSTGKFREIKKPERIVATDSFADEKGNVVPATYYGMNAAFPLETTATVTFGELAFRTQLTLRHAGIPPGTDHDLAREGWNQSLDKFAGIVARNAFGGGRIASAGEGEEMPGT